jgi:hypothetical protein
MSMWQRSFEGQVCAYSGYNALFPTCNQLATSCVLHVINLNGISCVETYGRLIVCQTWCRLQSGKYLVEYKFSYRHFYTGFRWLLVVCNEMFLRRIFQSWLYRPLPVCHNFSGACRCRITWAGLYTAAVGTALLLLSSPRNGQAAVHHFKNLLGC